MESSTIVTPGQRLCRESEYIASEGTYIHKGAIYSSVLGFSHVIKRHQSSEQDDQTKDKDDIVASTNENDLKKDYIVVMKEKDPGVVPDIGSVVTAQVLRNNPRLASVAILCVGTKALKETFNGIIRVQDVRATEIDKVEIYKSFRPGDIVVAQVISLGDSRSYYLSTAKNELGVVFAQMAKMELDSDENNNEDNNNNNNENGDEQENEEAES
ncbi:hypothetical protein SAMD00019534_024030 [Acytostelium subglobosum LB1]|uniref:hypothetical protein n=1 Tax=Acytostelium subglobosum LB1 TaxID=1410327 RepID=UPI000644A9AD|nr:hypothetical protein SAMD00019534_024030 [Acytostelium subglobosum LB1]GAM19228.1 hypothetical protein SAMD00019534_024030 [Acytostelium subglobosum LB1]|eukprot:XP_012757155.1 hypothetical protein SAMD00019534_024030 [Acytostelium subglobosum LB1]